MLSEIHKSPEKRVYEHELPQLLPNSTHVRYYWKYKWLQYAIM